VGYPAVAEPPPCHPGAWALLEERLHKSTEFDPGHSKPEILLWRPAAPGSSLQLQLSQSAIHEDSSTAKLPLTASR